MSMGTAFEKPSHIHHTTHESIMPTPSITGLFPSFIGSATVLNDGTSANVLTVALTNDNMQQGSSDLDISITPELNLAFYFIADGNAEDGKKTIKDKTFELNWALAGKANIDGIVPHLFLPGETIDYASLSNQKRIPEGWKINSDTPNVKLGTLSTLQGWKISPPDKGYTLRPGQSLILVFTNIISDLPNGPSTAYMAYQEKHFIKCGPLQKTPSVISGNKVGIGTTNPKYPLSIQTSSDGPKISIWDKEDEGKSGRMSGFGTSNNTLNYQTYKHGGHFFRAGGTNNDGVELARIVHEDQGNDGDGNTGIAKMVINGYLGIETPFNQLPEIKLAIGATNTGIHFTKEEGLALRVRGHDCLTADASGVVQIGNANFINLEKTFVLANNGKWNLKIGPDGKVGIGGMTGDPQRTLALGGQNDPYSGIDSGNNGELTIYAYKTPVVKISTQGVDILGNDSAAGSIPLAISRNDNGPKISLWDNGNPATGYNGFSISSEQMNYLVWKDTNDHVFYSGSSTKDRGAELFRVTGKGKLLAGKIPSWSGKTSRG
ncbi:MAG: hypothetical protein R3B47_07390 [Bacteroidia bacterium]